MTNLTESITHTHPAVTRCFPDGRVETHNITMAKMFAEVIRDGLPLLTEDELKQLPKVQQMLHEAFIAGCQQGSEDNENGVEEINSSAYPHPDGPLEQMISAGELAPAARDMDATDVLYEWMQGLDTDQIIVDLVNGMQMTGAIRHYPNEPYVEVTVEDDRQTILLASEHPGYNDVNDRGWNTKVTRITPAKG